MLSSHWQMNMETARVREVHCGYLWGTIENCGRTATPVLGAVEPFNVVTVRQYLIVACYGTAYAGLG